MDIWTRDGWILNKQGGAYKIIYNYGLSNREVKLVISEEAWDIYQLALRVKPGFLEIVSIGQPIMRIPNG